MPDEATGVVIAYVTTPPGEAEPLARSLVESRLAACVNILPAVRSVYRWRDAIKNDEESLLVIKSTIAGLPTLIRYVEEHHSYEVPEVIALPVVAGARGYLDWVTASVDEDGEIA